MNRTNRLVIAPIIIVAVIGTILGLQLPEASTGPDPNCLTISEAAAKVTDIAVKVPDGLPAGFEFRCAKGGGPEVYLTFAPSGISLAGEKSADLDRGAIVLFAINQEAFIGSEAFSLRNTTQEIIDTVKEVEKSNPAVNPTLRFIGETPIFIRSACEDCAVQRAIFEDGQEIVQHSESPTRLKFWAGPVQYIIEGYLPADALLNIAESVIRG